MVLILSMMNKLVGEPALGSVVAIITEGHLKVFS
jgi:hypothetical protein